jgi:hypothetical protein
LPAKVTELGGPGLRIETKLKVKAGNRVLVIVNLSEEKGQDSNPSLRNSSLRPVITKNRKNTPSTIIEDIGVVKHVRAIHNGSSIAVELTGLTDSNLNELIRATNKAYRKTNSKDTSNPSGTEETFAEPVIV